MKMLPKISTCGMPREALLALLTPVGWIAEEELTVAFLLHLLTLRLNAIKLRE